MKARKITYKMKRDLSTTLEAMVVGQPRVIPYSDYSYNTVRVMIRRCEALSENNSKWDFYNSSDGTIIKKIQ